MKKPIVMLLAAAGLGLALSGCAGPVESLETLETASSGIVQAAVNPGDFDSNLEGLCRYMEASDSVIGEKTEMSYKEIGAIGGYRYRFRFDGSTVQAEFYEFDLDNLDQKGQECLDSVGAKGFFSLLGNDVPALLNGSYLMIYTDPDTDEVNAAQKEKAEKLFRDFGKQAS